MLVTLGGVVVNDVENDFDPGRVQLAHHLPKLWHRAGRSARGITRIRRQVTERVVAPVVRAATRYEEMFVDMIVHRK